MYSFGVYIEIYVSFKTFFIELFVPKFFEDTYFELDSNVKILFLCSPVYTERQFINSQDQHRVDILKTKAI